jgi:HSP20 family molecular chaperone IbpA
MANVARRQNTFNELFDLRSSFDHLFNRIANNSTGADDQSARLIFVVPPIEAWVDNDKKEYHLSIAVPGIDPKEVELKVHGNNLTVVGEHKGSDEKKGKDYLEQSSLTIASRDQSSCRQVYRRTSSALNTRMAFWKLAHRLANQLCQKK